MIDTEAELDALRIRMRHLLLELREDERRAIIQAANTLIDQWTTWIIRTRKRRESGKDGAK